MASEDGRTAPRVAAARRMDVRIGVDVGGTFTDLVALVDGRIHAEKVPTTPADQSLGVMSALGRNGQDPAAVQAFAHGMTVATNALLERRGARTALVTTAGFRDVIQIARQARPHLYDLTQDRPPALVPPELRFTVTERMGPEGELEPVDERSVDEAITQLREAAVDSVAVCFLFAFLHPAHEQQVGAAIRAALPDVHVSLSSEVLPEMREYERFSTTVADAYLAPTLSRYLKRLAVRLEGEGWPAPRVMQSSGGVVELADAGAQAATCVLSGPAGGVVGAAYVARASGFPNVLSFDMGGTSTDVAPIVGGEAETTNGAVVAGVALRHPIVDVHSVSAGGGSVAYVDSGGALRVGPHSAGADPGPACYGRGGEAATVTDANLLLGYLADGAALGGDVVLSRELAERAVADVGVKAGLDALEAAVGIVRLTNTGVVRALRLITIERGLDPRDFALMAFGGAGGMHACALAEELGMTTAIVPRAGGVLSALGLAICDLRRDYVMPMLGELDSLDRPAVERLFGGLEARAAADLEEPVLQRRADLRYRGQAFELTVEAQDLHGLAERFHERHHRRHGYRMDDQAVEMIAVRLTATRPTSKPALVEPPSANGRAPSRRPANFDGRWIETAVLHRAGLGAGSAVPGPAIIELDEATCVVRPGWEGVVDDAGSLVLSRRGG